MFDFFNGLWDTTGFLPRWQCGEWTALQGWLHIGSDVAMWGAYVAISFAMGLFVVRRRDVEFSRIFWLFAAFILACGTVHLIEAILFWWPVYRLSGLLKAFTAVVSWVTVAALASVVPAAVRIRSPGDLEAEITERRKMEQALLDSEERLNLCLQSARIGTWDWRVTENRVIWDDYIQPLFGFRVGTFPGTYDAFLATLHPDDRERVAREVALAVEEDAEYDTEYRVIWPDGSTHVIAARGTVYRDEQGTAERMNGVCWDVTRRREAEDELQYERQMLHSLMDYVPDCIYFKDAESRFVRINRATARNVRVDDPADAVGRTDFDFFAKEHAQSAYDDEQRIMRTGEPIVSKDEHEKWADGVDRWVTSTKLPLRDSQGRIVGTLGISRDITERKQAEIDLRRAKQEAEEASRAKSLFLANMSHEIRTPLNGIIGMTELLLGGEPTAEQREYLSMIVESADSLLSVINDILDFSKIEAGKLDLDNVDFDVRESFGDMLKSLAFRAHGKGLELACRIAEDVPSRLRGDPARLRQIVVNLIGNAIKFTDAGEVVLDVTVDALSDDEAALHLAVRDTGVGIAADKIEAVFDAFEQADASITRRFGGTGLGLAISAKLVELMGGRIWVDSREGKGSTFHFTAEFTHPVRHVNHAESDAAQLRGTRILVVDDNAAHRSIVDEMIRSWGLCPSSAASAEEALDMLREPREPNDRIALVLADGEMPGTDGFALAATIERDASLNLPVILMLTSNLPSAKKYRGGTRGIAAALTKPLKHSELLEAIEAVLSNPEATFQMATSVGARRDPATRPLHILLAEDSLVNQKLTVGLLGQRGHAVVVANNGREAIDALETDTFDVVLMDLQMPELDGLEATQLIRQDERSSGGHVPIIAMTAHAMRGDRERCLEAGMDEYISKPIRADELIEKVERFGGGVPSGDEAKAVLARPDVSSTERCRPDDREADSVDGAVDWQAALHTAGGNRDLLRELVEAFLDEGPQLLDAMRDAVRDGDASALHRTAHRMKGSMKYFGAEDAYREVWRLETMGSDGNLEDAEAALAALDREAHRLELALRAFAKRGGDVRT